MCLAMITTAIQAPGSAPLPLKARSHQNRAAFRHVSCGKNPCQLNHARFYPSRHRSRHAFLDCRLPEFPLTPLRWSRIQCAESNIGVQKTIQSRTPDSDNCPEVITAPNRKNGLHSHLGCTRYIISCSVVHQLTRKPETSFKRWCRLNGVATCKTVQGVGAF